MALKRPTYMIATERIPCWGFSLNRFLLPDAVGAKRKGNQEVTRLGFDEEGVHYQDS